MAANQNRHERQAKKQARNVARRAKNDASRDGFHNFLTGNILCQDRSRSSNVSELEVDLAARQIEHCLEAWNFLSQATWSLLNCQDNQAIHMAYYSEIRSANSLLASSGIAEKSSASYFIRSDNAREDIAGARTHTFVKYVWPLWSQRTDAIEAFESLKVTQSITLKDVGSALFRSRLSNSQAVNHWGYELTKFHNDSSARNRASYQTSHAYNGIPSLRNRNHCQIVALAWDHLQPGGIDGQMQFEIIYAQYLVHSYCLDKATENNIVNPQNYDAELTRFIERLSGNTGSQETLLAQIFPLSADYEDDRFNLFLHAERPNSGPENIYCRAVILARLATNKLNANIEATHSRRALDWIELWLQESGVIAEQDSIHEVIAYANEYIDSAANIRAINLREIWSTEQNAKNASMACKINSSLCWGLSDQV